MGAGVVYVTVLAIGGVLFLVAISDLVFEWLD